MVKLLGYKSTHMNKYTMFTVNYNATADFDRMYHGYRNMLDTKKNIDRVIYECMSGTLERATRNVDTGLGMSSIAYEQRRGEENMTGEIKDKANVPRRSTLQKDQMIQAHNEMPRGVEHYTPDMRSKTMYHWVIFIDNRTRRVTSNSGEDKTTKDLSDCAKSAQREMRKCGIT